MSTNHGKAREDKPEVEGKERYRVRITTKRKNGSLGRGATANIYLAEDIVDNRPAVLKVFISKLTNHLENAEREIFLNQHIQHDHIIQFFDKYMIGSENNTETTVLVFEYAAGGSLDHYMDENHEKTKGEISEKDASSIILQVSSAVKYLHNLTEPIFHGDIKPGNILLTSDKEFPGIVKLSDFGDGRMLRSSDAEIKFEGGTPGFDSPEQHYLRKSGLKADIWSLGVVAFGMLTGYMPFGKPANHQSDFRKFEEYNAISEYGRTFIESLFKKHKDRPNAAETYTLAEEWRALASPKIQCSTQLGPPARGSHGGTSSGDIARAGHGTHKEQAPTSRGARGG